MKILATLCLAIALSIGAMATVDLNIQASQQDCIGINCDGTFDPTGGTAFISITFDSGSSAFVQLANPTSIMQTQDGWIATYGLQPAGSMMISLLVNGQLYTFSGRSVSGEADISQSDPQDELLDVNANFIGTWNNGFHSTGNMGFSFQTIDGIPSSLANINASTTELPEPSSLLLWLAPLGLVARRFVC